MKIKIIFTLMVLQIIHSGSAHAQTHPFPKNMKYPYGFMSKNITHVDAQKMYENWKKGFIRTCGENEARVINIMKGVETTVSEGIGYGMAIVVYAGDKDLYDKLLNYYLTRRNNHGMMNWIYENCATGDNQKNGATDAEMDAALSLVVAARQWPSDARYKLEAGKVIDSMQIYYFTQCGNIIVQKPGDTFGGCTCTNPSYYSPAYYRVFAQFKEEEGKTAARDFWMTAAEDSYVTLLKNSNSSTGLVYAWTNAEGGNPSNCYYEVSGGGTFNSYQYDACRMPWRIATDYLWWGNAQAEACTKKITNFVKTPIYKQTAANGDLWYGAGGITNVVDGYWHNGLRRIDTVGAAYGHRHTIPFVGAFAVASMSSSQEDADVFMKEFQSLAPINYYESCLSVLYTFLATGNFWNPYGVQ